MLPARAGKMHLPKNPRLPGDFHQTVKQLLVNPRMIDAGNAAVPLLPCKIQLIPEELFKGTFRRLSPVFLAHGQGAPCHFDGGLDAENIRAQGRDRAAPSALRPDT